MFKSMWNGAKSCACKAASAVVKAKDKVVALAIAGGAAITMAASEARAEVTLPDVPVDFDAYSTAGMSVVTTVFAAIAGVVIVIALTRMGLRKLSGAFNGRA